MAPFGALGTALAGDFAQVGIGWEVGVPSGWGTYGVNLAVELARKGIEPALFLISSKTNVPQAQLESLQPALMKQREWLTAARKGGLKFDFPMLYSLGDGLQFDDVLIGTKGTPQAGVPFFESATIPTKNVEGSKASNVIIAGSTWNAEDLSRVLTKAFGAAAKGGPPRIGKP